MSRVDMTWGNVRMIGWDEGEEDMCSRDGISHDPTFGCLEAKKQVLLRLVQHLVSAAYLPSSSFNPNSPFFVDLSPYVDVPCELSHHHLMDGWEGGYKRLLTKMKSVIHIIYAADNKKKMLLCGNFTQRAEAEAE